MLLGIYKKKWLSWPVLLQNLSLASIGIVVLLVCSCRTMNENTSIRALDSLEWNRKVSVFPVTIPASLAELTVSLDSLRKLPGGAVYTKKSGHATASVGIKDGNLIVSAGCDSLQQIIYKLEEQLHQARDELRQKEVTREPFIIPFWTKLKWYLYGVLTMVLFITIKYIIKRWHIKTEK